jgi:dTDP-D-glucose 4,6-dehydratase
MQLPFRRMRASTVNFTTPKTFVEDTVRPRSPYSASKKQHHFVRAKYNTYGMPMVIFKLPRIILVRNHFPEIDPLMINNIKTKATSVYGKVRIFGTSRN